ncbi:MAG: pyridoxal-phosphate dependent enzyme [Nitrospirota bacterium]|nr:pyridoxal-phosphate dependent enzyme [Nitrospirota bacterium]
MTRKLPPDGLDRTADSCLDLIGATPLVRISRIARGLNPEVRILAKLERVNPGGSVKDRAALRMIIDAEQAGDLRKGRTILDSSSGNTGIAYAMIGAVRGYAVTIVIPENASSERKKIIAGFGAELVLSSPYEGADGAIGKAKELRDGDPGRYFQPDQYNNPSNAKAHELTTGPEIISQTQGSVTHFIACVGTGGTIMGTGRALRAFRRDIKVLSVHPDDALHGIEGTKFLEDGAIVPGIFDRNFPDERHSVSTEAAFEMTARLAREEGLFVGTSSGAALSAALTLADKLDRGTIVVMFPDGGDRYLSRQL